MVMQSYHPPNTSKQWISTKKGDFLGSSESHHKAKTQPCTHQIGHSGKIHARFESEG